MFVRATEVALMFLGGGIEVILTRKISFVFQYTKSSIARKIMLASRRVNVKKQTQWRVSYFFQDWK
jgi:2-phospho-L-lactate guanylyltransferase (CobY/MobA/RfbA family)